MSLTLEQWDNISSIASNSITAITIVLGAIFGRNKINEFLSTKKKEQAFNAALHLDKCIDNLWPIYGRLTISSNEIMTLLTTKQQQEIGKEDFNDIQKVYQKVTEEFSEFFSSHISIGHYGVKVKDTAMNDLVRKNGHVTVAVGSFFKLVLAYINTAQQPIPTIEEVREAYDELKELKLACGPAISAVKNIKFDDLYDFSSI
ncbi:hypothetical protein ACMV5L_14265 [Serratia plymuthica]|uniref:hypothetical protein n=1 Tax=Serratia plymuthica TaxID=82996 RepID=UPI003DA2950B